MNRLDLIRPADRSGRGIRSMPMGSSDRCRFSVIIPTFNNGAELARAIESALACEQVVEVIVVDDGSNSPVALDAFTSDAVHSDEHGDRRVVPIRIDNSGPAAARNAGAAVAKGHFLVFLDADDELLAGAASVFAGEIGESAPGVWTALVRTGCIRVGSDGVETAEFARPSEHAYPRGVPVCGSYAVDRLLFQAVGGFDDRFWYGENSEFLLRCALHLKHQVAESHADDHDSLGEPHPGEQGQPPPTIAFVEQPTVRYQVSVAGGSRNLTHRAQSAALMIDKHGDALDPKTRADHLAIAAVCNRQIGNRKAAVRWAVKAAGARPTSIRSWLRVLRSIIGR